MIAIELTGGLGNQMFQYSFIYSQHKKLSVPFYIIKYGDTIDFYKYFKPEKNLFYCLDIVFFNHSGAKLFFSHYLRKWFYHLVGRLAIEKRLTADNRDGPCTVLKEATDKTLYSGYFQSESYFNENAAALRAILQIRAKYRKMFDREFKWLKNHKKIVTLHIRKTDYHTAFGHLSLGNTDLTLPMTYYHEVIARIQSEDNFYVFISDDISAIQTEFSYLENTFFSREDEITDFQLMLNADICVIANSTFSWWAAYLNNLAGKIIYCPKHFLGFLTGSDYPAQIYPEGWIQVPV